MATATSQEPVPMPAPRAGNEVSIARRGDQARLQSIDIIRGAVMILMALDHVRVYAGVPAGGPEYGVFFTRWITNFCAPAFVFLAGVAVFLYGTRPARTKRDLSRYLLTRGMWLVVLDLTVLRMAWTFNVDIAGYNVANIIWALGWSMILMAALVHLRPAAVGTIGVAIVAGHNALDLVRPAAAAVGGGAEPGWLWRVLYAGGPFDIGDGGPRLIVLYSLVPWIGVMAAGYGFGPVMRMTPERRRRVCFAIALGAVAAFVVLRYFNVYGNPRPWGGPASQLPPLLSFLNPAKYPASLLFLLMTLGPTLGAIPLAERASSRLVDPLLVFGRVPLFYYLLHIPLIHALTVLISLVRTPQHTWWLFGNHPMEPPPVPDGYMYSLPLLYIVTLIAVGLLYLPCRWFAALKARRQDSWLSYL